MVRDVNYVLGQVKAGKSIRFYQDFYGKQKIQLRGWLWREDIHLPDHEVQRLRDALSRRRRDGRHVANAA